MEFDFYKQYKGYSNIDLLKIIKRPEAYQVEAVAMAKKILNERMVSPEEIEYVEKYYDAIEDNVKNKKEKIDFYKRKAADFFEPVLHPSEKVEPAKWVNIFLLVIALQYAWSLFKQIKWLVNFSKCVYCEFDFTFFLEILNLIYIPLIFFLIYKRKRWGWILLVADNLFSLIIHLSQSFLFFEYRFIHGTSISEFLWPIFIKAIFVFFLWRNSVATYFNISKETKKKTAIVVTVGTLFFILLMYAFFGT